MSLAHVFAAPLWFGKYGGATFFEANVICLVVMYTDKVLRPCHMLMLVNTFWAERLTVVVGGGRTKRRRKRRKEATDGQLLPLQSQLPSNGHRLLSGYLGFDPPTHLPNLTTDPAEGAELHNVHPMGNS